MWGSWAVLLASLLVVGLAQDHGLQKMEEPLRPYCTVLEQVRAKPINENEAVFVFKFQGERKEFVLVKNTEIDSRVKFAYQAIDSTGFKNSLAIIFGEWDRPMLSGFVKIDGVIYSIQPVTHFLNVFPELEGTGATIAVSSTVLHNLYTGAGDFNQTIAEDRSQRKRGPSAPPNNPLTGSTRPDPEPPLPCPTDSAKKKVVIDTATDGAVYASVRAGLPASATQAQIIAAIEGEVALLVSWMGEVYGKTANYFFESGHILVKTSFDNTGNDWKTGAVSWNRNCDISRSSDRNYRSAWYGDTLDSWSCWIDQQPQKSQFTGALAQLLHGCAWNAGGTVGLAWIGVACDGSFQFNNQDGRRCGGRGSVSSYASSGLYIVTTHELGHNFGLPHNTTGIMTPSAGSVTDFSRQSQHYLCDLYPNQAGKCATDLIAGCDCPSSWECGSLCGQQCPGLSCGSGEECINNECIVPCVPQCGGFQCGPDGCGGECGQCSADTFCNSNRQCESLGGGFADHSTRINNERRRWGVASNADVSSSRYSCLSNILPACDAPNVSPWSCGGNSAYTYFYYTSQTFTDNQAIQYHLDDVLALGDSYDCAADTFSSGSTTARRLYRTYIWDRENVVIGYGVQHGCGGFKLLILTSAVSRPPLTTCPNSTCNPNSCAAAINCQLDGQNDGCSGTMSCPCPGSQICFGSSCCAPDSCLANEWECGSVNPGCGFETENCGSCSGDNVCVMEGGNTGGVCCTPRTCEDVGCGVTLAAADNCGIELVCGCDAGEECQINNAGINTCCSPLTCGAVGNSCGSVPNGCGGSISCGCSGSDVCFPDTCCTPLTCDTHPSECGVNLGNNCGGTINCGCSSGQACVAGSCVVVPTPTPTPAPSLVCDPCPTGTVCGEITCNDGVTTVSCGTCGSNEVCSGDWTECQCVPKTKAEACAMVTCGPADNGCGGTVTCDNTCNPGTHVCIEETNSCCQLATCPSSQECGTIELGCGVDGTIDCGSGCSTGEFCDDGTCSCPIPCDANPDSCGVYSNACVRTHCGFCSEGDLCDDLAPGGGVCVPESDCCTCPSGTTWNGVECSTDPPVDKTCIGEWEEHSGFLYPDGVPRRIFTPSSDSDCSIYSVAINGGDIACDVNNPRRLCMNLFVYQDFQSSQYGDGVSVDVQDLGGPDGSFGIFLSGNNIVETADSTTANLIAGYINRQEGNVRFGYASYNQEGFDSNADFFGSTSFATVGYGTNENWYRVSLKKDSTTSPGLCRLTFTIFPLDSDGNLQGRGGRWSIYPRCSDLERTVGSGGQFGLLSNQPAQFRNFAILSGSAATFRLYFPFCPQAEAVTMRVAFLLGIHPSQLTDVNVVCGNLGPARQASAGGLVTVSLTITSDTVPATALASRLEYLLTSGKAGVAFDTTAGFTSSSGAPPFSGEITAVEPPPTTFSSGGGGGGGGGGSGGLSSGAIAGIAIGATVAVAAVLVGVAVAVKKSQDSGSRGGEATSYSEGNGNKGVPVMNPESHQRRVVEGEMTSVTGRGGQ